MHQYALVVALCNCGRYSSGTLLSNKGRVHEDCNSAEELSPFINFLYLGNIVLFMVVSKTGYVHKGQGEKLQRTRSNDLTFIPRVTSMNPIACPWQFDLNSVS